MKGKKNIKIHITSRFIIKFYNNVVNTLRCVAPWLYVGSLIAFNILNEIIVAREA